VACPSGIALAQGIASRSAARDPPAAGPHPARRAL